jgi:hypothetical protein
MLCATSSRIGASVRDIFRSMAATRIHIDLSSPNLFIGFDGFGQELGSLEVRPREPARVVEPRGD